MNEAIILAAAELEKSHPTRWAEFMIALKGYSDNCTDQCISSTPEGLSTAQGRAQQIRAFLKMLEDCSATSDQIRKIRNEKARTR